uniref:Uncharacterized protein n=1 Tax=Utricularia reniformis TaxID=192314 RepID=A0A1Y0B1P6_9LAMI|nr:hypothetical protein AEK19_MT1161 [Utricularia reniformis]ART31375.1 hypothetical protein AEK19_MT1161 [Utricularia reniformis]
MNHKTLSYSPTHETGKSGRDRQFIMLEPTFRAFSGSSSLSYLILNIWLFSCLRCSSASGVVILCFYSHVHVDLLVLA